MLIQEFLVVKFCMLRPVAVLLINMRRNLEAV